MTIDSGGNASVSLSDLFDGNTTQLGDFSVGNVGLGSFYILLGQQESNYKQAQYYGQHGSGLVLRRPLAELLLAPSCRHFQ